MVQGRGDPGHRAWWPRISRSVTHAMNWLGAEFAIAAVSDTLMPIGDLDRGAPVRRGVGALPRRALPHGRGRRGGAARSIELAAPKHQQALRREAEQLARGPSRQGSRAPSSRPRRGPGRSARSSWTSRRGRTARSCGSCARTRRSRSSTGSPSSASQLGEMIPAPSPAMVAEGSRWVYYPWRRAVVRLLASRPFSALRLDRNRNKLTIAEQSRLRSLRVGVVGLSAGHTIAHVLAMEGLVGEIRLADFDTLELSNLNRIPASVLDLGVNKAVVAARRIAEIDPYLRVIVDTDGVTAENLGAFLDGLDVVDRGVRLARHEVPRPRGGARPAHPGDHGDERPRRARRRALRPRPGPADLPRPPGRHGLVAAGRSHDGAEGALRRATDRSRARRRRAGPRRCSRWVRRSPGGRSSAARSPSARRRSPRPSAGSDLVGSCRRAACASTSRRSSRASDRSRSTSRPKSTSSPRRRSIRPSRATTRSR